MNEEIKKRLNACLKSTEIAIEALYSVTYNNKECNFHKELNELLKRILLKYDK